ncbi:B3 domain-containing transcription factor VRN1-like [Fagus crenata]
MFQSEYPFFKTVLWHHNIYNSFVYVPAGFALKYLPLESIKLQNSDGKQWSALSFYREGPSAGRSIGKGWYVPAGFALKYLSSESIKLQNSDGKQWSTRCFYREGSGAGRSIGKGWATFSKENDLEEGDVVIF